MMNLETSPGVVEFRLSDLVVGCYRYSDEFKPHLHPLRTPRGHCVTSASPHDHKHHKGLMYALRTEDVNFWEETSTLPGEVAGVQRHLDFQEPIRRGLEVGFIEKLEWCAQDGSLPSFEETRTIFCRQDSQSFLWTWKTQLTALRPLTLVQSQWSHLDSGSGKKTNYHGLGIRLRRDMGGLTRGNQLVLDGVVHDGDFTTYMGSIPRVVSFAGRLDGTFPVESACVTFGQDQKNALYVCNDVFPFMALGPTNASGMQLRAGDRIEESYTVLVADVPSP